MGILNFSAYSKQKKKSYLIDFSFKFNEIKFCTLLMNWLIWEKIFTYFYNKFRSLNHMHYVKYGVVHYSHNSGCCGRSVAHWIAVLSRHTLFTVRVIYRFTFV